MHAFIQLMQEVLNKPAKKFFIRVYRHENSYVQDILLNTFDLSWVGTGKGPEIYSKNMIVFVNEFGIMYHAEFLVDEYDNPTGPRNKDVSSGEFTEISKMHLLQAARLKKGLASDISHRRLIRFVLRRPKE